MRKNNPTEKKSETATAQRPPYHRCWPSTKTSQPTLANRLEADLSNIFESFETNETEAGEEEFDEESDGRTDAFVQPDTLNKAQPI